MQRPIEGAIFLNFSFIGASPDDGDEAPLQDLFWGGLRLGSLRVVEAASADVGPDHDSAILPAAVVRHTCQSTSVLAGLRACLLQLQLNPSSVLVCAHPSAAQCYGACHALGCRWLVQGRIDSAVATAVAVSHRTSGCLLVAVAMKVSRWRDFLRRGFFPVVARQHIVFLRVDLQNFGKCAFPFDVLLHKATDELVGLDDAGNPVFSPDMTALLESVQAMALVTCLDKPTSLRKVINRELMANVLEAASAASHGHSATLATPGCVRVDSLDGCETIFNGFSKGGLNPPIVLKPLAACGMGDAHEMIIILGGNECASWSAIKFPAIAQPFINHGGVVHKVTVLGDQVHVTQRPSIPDIHSTYKVKAEFDSLVAIPFDSQNIAALSRVLKDAYPATPAHDEGGASESLNFGVITGAARYLRRELDFHIFGFDVIIENETGQHYIVDLNYFPSLRDVPTACESLWEICRKVSCKATTHQQ
ncbi:Inositol-tetrakisphosphate 1-kinase [Coccomyxa sp. Obi]|nr:Inositol-tetrakisphosphate 1-kinase [Coccomyxa sp. Obi]